MNKYFSQHPYEDFKPAQGTLGVYVVPPLGGFFPPKGGTTYNQLIRNNNPFKYRPSLWARLNGWSGPGPSTFNT